MFLTNGSHSARVAGFNPGWQFRVLAPMLSCLSQDQPTVGAKGALRWS